MNLVLYSVLRILVFLAALGLGYVLGLRSWLLVLVAVVLAAAASYVFLRGPRDAAVTELASGAERRRDRPAVDADAEHEDAADEAERRRADARAASGREGDPEDKAVDQLEEPRVAQDEHEVAPGGAGEHTSRETPGRER